MTTPIKSSAREFERVMHHSLYRAADVACTGTTEIVDATTDHNSRCVWQTLSQGFRDQRDGLVGHGFVESVQELKDCLS